MRKIIGILLLSLLFGCTSKMKTATVLPTLPIPTLTNLPLTTIPTNTLPPEIMGEKPEPRSGGLMVYDSDRGVSILLGRKAEPDIYFDDMWEYDGFEWKKIKCKISCGGMVFFQILPMMQTGKRLYFLTGQNPNFGSLMESHGKRWKY